MIKTKNHRHPNAPNLTPGAWRRGNCAAVVTDWDRSPLEPRTRDYYGGHVVCESIANPADFDLLVNAKRLLIAAANLLSVDTDVEPIDDAWAELVAAVEKAGGVLWND